MKINAKELSKFMSTYLLDGFKRENYKITLVDINKEKKTLTAHVNIENCHTDMDGKFHLSTPINAIITGQLYIIYIFYILGQSKNKEIYALIEDWKYKNPIYKSEDIFYTIKETRCIKRGSRSFYEFRVEVEDGSFLGTILVTYEN